MSDWADEVARSMGDEYDAGFAAIASALRETRNKALDEAAKLSADWWTNDDGGYEDDEAVCKFIASAILALKTKAP